MKEQTKHFIISLIIWYSFIGITLLGDQDKTLSIIFLIIGIPFCWYFAKVVLTIVEEEKKMKAKVSMKDYEKTYKETFAKNKRVENGVKNCLLKLGELIEEDLEIMCNARKQGICYYEGTCPHQSNTDPEIIPEEEIK